MIHETPDVPGLAGGNVQGSGTRRRETGGILVHGFLTFDWHIPAATHEGSMPDTLRVCACDKPSEAINPIRSQ